MQAKIVGENIKRQREARSWTQEHLAEAAQVDVRTVQRAEAGTGIGSESLLAIAGSFGIDVEILKRDPDAEELEKLARRFQVLHLDRIDHGAQLGGLLPVGMINFSAPTDLDSENADLAADFHQELLDCNDIWREIGPVGQRDGEKSLQRHIDQLKQNGLVTTATRRVQKLKHLDNGSSITLLTLFVLVSTDPRTVALLDKEKPIFLG